jgi:hypothetical protein
MKNIKPHVDNLHEAFHIIITYKGLVSHIIKSYQQEFKHAFLDRCFRSAIIKMIRNIKYI